MNTGRDVLKNYVPAVVYTLYDGYYIYSSYNNVLDEKDEFDDKTTYVRNEQIDGLKPYIYYSCRYKKGDADLIITYSLDNYITIQGKLSDNQPLNKSGYLLTGVDFDERNGLTYRGIKIDEEDAIYENVYEENSTDISGKEVIIVDEDGAQYNTGKIVSYPCRKINGVKYYYNERDNEVFSIINDVKYKQNNISGEAIKNNQNAIDYYKNAYELKKFIESNDILRNLSISDAIDSKGHYYNEYGEENPYYQYGNIFAELFNTTGKYIEDSDSNFNAHRLQVIKNSVESGLMVAIANFNKVSTSEVNFQMPKLQDYEWEQITDNISMISFLQGFNIGGKIYNGHAIISNNINEEYVSANSIYMIDDNEYKTVTDTTLTNGSEVRNYIGILNTNFERKLGQATYKKNIVNEEGNIVDSTTLNKTIYYYPRNELGSYTSIVDTNNTINNTLEEYVKSLLNNLPGTKEYNLAKAYYIALGRERNGMYRVTNKLEEIQEGIRIQSLGGKFENDSGKVYAYFPPGYKLDDTKTINGNYHIVKN